MKILPFISCLLACSAAPSDLRTVVVTDAVFKEKFVIYTAQHDIVKIYVPFNRNNFQTDYPHVWFFVEANENNGVKVDQGLYVYKDHKATKLFNGRDAVADNNNVVYFGAVDGIYKYNESANTAEKHGTVTDNVIQMAHNKVNNNVYYLTANHEVFRLTTDAVASVKIPLQNVEAFVFGSEGNMYYCDTDKNVYVFTNAPDAEPKKINGLPSAINKLILVAPMNGMGEGSILLADKALYVLKPDATVTRKFVPNLAVHLEVELSAYAPQTTMLQLYAKEKKLYEYNLFTMKDELKSLIGL